MVKLLRIVHFLGLVLFLGSIPAHIMLAGMAEPPADAAAASLLMQVKLASVQSHTTVGIGLTFVSGILLLVMPGVVSPRARWMIAKYALTALVLLNGVAFLSPLARDIASAARAVADGGASPAVLAALGKRELAHGAANIVMILATVALSYGKPALGEPAPVGGARAAS